MTCAARPPQRGDRPQRREPRQHTPLAWQTGVGTRRPLRRCPGATAPPAPGPPLLPPPGSARPRGRLLSLGYRACPKCLAPKQDKGQSFPSVTHSGHLAGLGPRVRLGSCEEWVLAPAGPGLIRFQETQWPEWASPAAAFNLSRFLQTPPISRGGSVPLPPRRPQHGHKCFSCVKTRHFPSGRWKWQPERPGPAPQGPSGPSSSQSRGTGAPAPSVLARPRL